MHHAKHNAAKPMMLASMAWYRLLCEEHIPFAIVTEDDIACGALSDYACLLLGNVEV